MPVAGTAPDHSTPAVTAREFAEKSVSAPADSSPPSGAPPALGPDPRRPSKSLAIDLRIGGDGFRVGGRMSDSKGVSSAWLGARLRDDGVTLDGRLEGQDGPTRDFALNLDLLPGWARTAAKLWFLLR
jgi:hypothetical protein